MGKRWPWVRSENLNTRPRGFVAQGLQSQVFSYSTQNTSLSPPFCSPPLPSSSLPSPLPPFTSPCHLCVCVCVCPRVSDQLLYLLLLRTAHRVPLINLSLVWRQADIVRGDLALPSSLFTSIQEALCSHTTTHSSIAQPFIPASTFNPGVF